MATPVFASKASYPSLVYAAEVEHGLVALIPEPDFVANVACSRRAAHALQYCRHAIAGELQRLRSNKANLDGPHPFAIKSQTRLGRTVLRGAAELRKGQLVALQADATEIAIAAATSGHTSVHTELQCDHRAIDNTRLIDVLDLPGGAWKFHSCFLRSTTG